MYTNVISLNPVKLMASPEAVKQLYLKVIMFLAEAIFGDILKWDLYLLCYESLKV